MALNAPRSRRAGVKLCFGDVHASWPQIIFCVALLGLLLFTTIDLLSTGYVLMETEKFLKWMNSKDMAMLVLIFVVFGAIAIVALVPQTVLFLGAGFVCASRITNPVLAFFAGLCLSMATFIVGATTAFLLSRSVLPPSCTRKFFAHFTILDGLDHALRHNGRRIIMLLRVNPLMPYNALNYGLGLSSCTLRHYIEGMLGAVPFTCVAVYAGMAIRTIDDVDTMFSHTDPFWYGIYAIFVVLCIVSCVYLVRYTAAEMKAAVAAAEKVDDGGGEELDDCEVGAGGRQDGEDDFGDLDDRDSTMFGTFVTREANAEGGDVNGHDMTELGEGGVSRVPLLARTGEGRRKLEKEGRGGGGGRGGEEWASKARIKSPSVVDV